MAQLLQNDPGFEAFLNQQVGNGTTWGDYMSMPMPDAYALERQYRQQQAAQQAQKQAPVQQPVQDPWASVGGRNFDPTTGTFKNTGHTIADLDRAIQAQQAVRQQQAQTPVVRQGGTGSVRNGRGAVHNGNGSGTRGGTGTTPPAQPTAPTYDSNWVNGSYGDIVALSKQLAEAERKQQPTEQKTGKPTIAPDGYMEGFDDISMLPVREKFSNVAPKNTDYSMGDADDSDVSPETAARNLLASGFVPTTPLGEIQAEQSILPERIRKSIGKRNNTFGVGFNDEAQARQMYQEALKLEREGKLKGKGPLGSDISAEDFALLSNNGKASILNPTWANILGLNVTDYSDPFMDISQFLSASKLSKVKPIRRSGKQAAKAVEDTLHAYTPSSTGPLPTLTKGRFTNGVAPSGPIPPGQEATGNPIMDALLDNIVQGSRTKLGLVTKPTGSLPAQAVPTRDLDKLAKLFGFK